MVSDVCPPPSNQTRPNKICSVTGPVTALNISGATSIFLRLAVTDRPPPIMVSDFYHHRLIRPVQIRFVVTLALEKVDKKMFLFFHVYRGWEVFS